MILGFTLFLSSAGSPMAEERIRVASIYAHTGIAAEQDQPSLRGLRVALEEINSRGGVLGKRITLLEMDNGSSPIGSKVVAEKAVGEDVAAILGSSRSTYSLAVARVAQAHKIPMVTNISTNTKVTQIGDYIFRVCYTDAFQGRVMAHFAVKELKQGTVVIFTNLTSDFSIELAREFSDHFEKAGGKVLLELTYKQRQDSFAEAVLRAGKTDPDVLFIPGHDESGRIIKEAIRAGLRALPLGGDGWDADSFFEKGGRQLEKGYYCTHWCEDVDSEISRNFVKRYQSGAPLHSAEALAYDAFLLLVDAIRRAGSTEREILRDALANTRDFQGVTGSISFNALGDPIKDAVIMEIRHGVPRYWKSIFVNP